MGRASRRKHQTTRDQRVQRPPVEGLPRNLTRLAHQLLSAGLDYEIFRIESDDELMLWCEYEYLGPFLAPFVDGWINEDGEECYWDELGYFGAVWRRGRFLRADVSWDKAAYHDRLQRLGDLDKALEWLLRQNVRPRDPNERFRVYDFESTYDLDWPGRGLLCRDDFEDEPRERHLAVVE